MEDTGERHILKTEFEDSSDYYVHLLHLASYEFAMPYAEGKKVLDYGCGSGYGASMLSVMACSVTAVDVSDEALSYAQAHYSSANLNFMRISELGGQRFDVITSFQVIEHVPDEKAYLRTLWEMLNPGGILLLTTPDRKGRLFKYIQCPWNKYHLKEYSFQGMSRLVRKVFCNFDVLKISSVPELVLPEVQRRKKLRWITLPCTLFFYPHVVRCFLLDFQTMCYQKLKQILMKGRKTAPAERSCKEPSYLKYTSKDIVISDTVAYSTDLFVICKKGLFN